MLQDIDKELKELSLRRAELDEEIYLLDVKIERLRQQRLQLSVEEQMAYHDEEETMWDVL